MTKWTRYFKQFLLDIGNDFIQKTVGKTLMIKNSLKKGPVIEDDEIVKFAMGNLNSFSIWNKHSQKKYPRNKKTKKEQKPIQKETCASNTGSTGLINR